GHVVPLLLRGAAHQLPNHLSLEPDRKEAVVEAVVVEDVREGRRQDGPEAVLLQGPGGVLPGGAAPEVGPGDEDGRPLVAGQVEDEVGPGLALLIVPPV